MKSVINFYKNAFTSETETITVLENKTIKEVLPTVDFKNCLIFVNGWQKKEDYCLKDGDICVIRQYPSEIVTGFIAVLSFAMWGITIGFGIEKGIEKLKNNTKSESNSPEETVTHPSISGSKNSSAYGRPVPLILGKTYFTPYYVGSSSNGYTTIYGEDGKDELYTNLYILGYKNLQVRDIRLGQITIAYNDGKHKGVLQSEGYSSLKSSTKEVENGEIPLNYTYDLLNQNRNIAYFNPEDYKINLELKQNGKNISFFNQKVVQTIINSELLSTYNKEDENIDNVNVYGFSAKYPQKVQLEIQFPNGIIGYDKEGEKKNVKVGIRILMSVNGGTNWTVVSSPFDTSNATGSITVENGTTYFEYQKAETMRFVANISFTYSTASTIKNNIAEFKVFKTTYLGEDDSYSSFTDTVYFTKIRTWCYDYSKSKLANSFVSQVPIESRLLNKIAILGLQIKAGDEVQNQIDELNCVLTSKCPIYQNGKWTDDLYATENPASLARYVMKGSFRGDFAYTDDKIDDDSFGAFYDWCATSFNFGNGGVMSRFAFDGAIVKKTKTQDLINSILSCGRGYKVLNGSKYGVFIDKPQDITVHILNNQNILSRSNQKNFDNLADGYQVKFMNALLDNEEDEIVVIPNDNENYDNPDLATLESVEYPYINNAYRAKCMALYQLAIQKHRPETWSVKVSIDGNLIEIGNKIEIQDNTISVGIGDGAEIKELIYDSETNPTEIIGIKTDGCFSVNDTSQSYGIKTIKYYDDNGVQIPHKIANEVNANRVGNFSEFYFTSPISLDERYLYENGDIISFGIFKSETAEALCVEKKDNGDGTFELLVVPYNEKIYTADSGSLGEFDSKVTPPQLSEVSSVTVLPKEFYELKNGIPSIAENVATKLITTTIDVNKYTLDLSPEAQSIPVNESGTLTSSWFNISAYLYYKDALVTENVTYKAFLSDGVSEVGTWNGNSCTISSYFLKGDILYLIIRASYTIDGSNVVKREVQAQVSRLYGLGTNVYKMLFPDGEKVRIDDTGTVLEPTQIRAEKRVANGTSENSTVFGKITIETVPNGTEEEYSPYVKVEDEENYSSKKKYYIKTEPFLIKVSDDTVLGSESNVGALFFKEIDL